MKISGDLTITKDNAHEYAGITSVGGALRVYCDFAAPLLTECTYAWASDGSTLNMPLLTECTYARADGGSTMSLPLLGETIADDGQYGLFRKFSGTYHAGCRQGLTAAQALKHWSRTDERAKLFTAAIKKAEKAANQKG